MFNPGTFVLGIIFGVILLFVVTAFSKDETE